jgi:hypothetical protein
MKITKKLATKLHKGTQRKKNLCNLRNLWFLFFIPLRSCPRSHEEQP